MENKILKIISARELQNKDLPELNVIVEDMIFQGLIILASPPKYGKSWLMLDLCLSVATGKDFLGHKTNAGQCLYLALEDSQRRLKDRMEKVLNGEDAPTNFDYAVNAESIESGLINQLESYIAEKKDTKLIVIDTLQKVRGHITKNDTLYSNDYKEIGYLKKFADKHNIALILVHHLRKMSDNADVFNQISGTNGISGAADTMIVMSKEKRSNNQTKMSIIGRDVESSEILLEFNNTDFKWNIIGSLEEQDKIRREKTYRMNPLVRTIIKLVEEQPKGILLTASEIRTKMFTYYWIAT